METQQTINFNRITEAIRYINENFRTQPELEEIAAKVNLSPFHFQRLFSEWAGVSPKKFLQYISVEYAKQLLQQKDITLADAAFNAGLSGTGRLHDLFISIEGMTPGEYKKGGAQLLIQYSLVETPFGRAIIASTTKGVCYMAFFEDEAVAVSELQQHFPGAQYKQEVTIMQKNALKIFDTQKEQPGHIRLHLKGTPFQVKVWQALLKIPSGDVSTYASVAGIIGRPGASRAVGTAVGDNPVAYLIPCHRVIRSTGILGEYHWGSARKAAMIGWEASKINAAVTDDKEIGIV